MSCHLDEGVLQALLDDELPAGDAAAVRQHIAICSACEEAFLQVSRAAEQLTVALELLDGDDRPVHARPSASASRRRIRVQRVALPWAAVFLMCFAAATYAIPGSPVRDWIADRIDISILPIPIADRIPLALDDFASPPSRNTEFGVQIEPLDGRLRFTLTRPSPELRIIARLTDLQDGWAYAVGGAAEAHFARTAGNLEVSDARDGELRIEIPRLTTSAVIEVDGRTYLIKDGDQLRLLSTPGDSIAAEIIFGVHP